MRMRETPRSLSIYFVIIGLLGLISNLGGMFQFKGDLVLVLLVLPGIGFSVAFLYFGFRLRSLLPASTQWVIRVLVASAIYWIILFLLTPFAGIAEAVQLVIGLLIIFYLIRNIRRLSTEMAVQTRAAEPGASADAGANRPHG